MISERVTWPEAQIVADLVAAHYARTGRNPTDAETAAMVKIARGLALTGSALQ